MSNKPRKSTEPSSAKITRIKATDTKPEAKELKAVKSAATPKAAQTSDRKNSSNTKKVKRNPLAGLAGYFKGAWQEIRLVRWPTRRATWGMTAAVLAYTALFVVLIVVLDIGFSKLLEAMIG